MNNKSSLSRFYGNRAKFFLKKGCQNAESVTKSLVIFRYSRGFSRTRFPAYRDKTQAF